MFLLLPLQVRIKWKLNIKSKIQLQKKACLGCVMEKIGSNRNNTHLNLTNMYTLSILVFQKTTVHLVG